MKLKDYMKSKKMTQQAAADKWDISRSLISMLISGERRATVRMQKWISAKTKGAVKEGDWK
jgi:transcriptional regulator with XRE-family HTH domain